MSKLEESVKAVEHAIEVWNRRMRASEAELRAAKDWLNKAGDAVAHEHGIDRHLQLVKNYKVALAVFLQTNFGKKAEKPTVS